MTTPKQAKTETDERLPRRRPTAGAPQAPDQIPDIDPAELFDPEEFGVHRRKP
jgi:hypothetical protein